MYHPSIWHPIQPLDMAAAFRTIRQATSSSSPNSILNSPEKNSFSAAMAAFNAANGAFSVNTLLNQTSPDHLRFPSTHPSLTATAAAAAAAAHQHHLFSTLFHHYPYAAAFRPLLNGTTSTSSTVPTSVTANTGLLTSSTNSNSSLSSASSSESSAFVPAGKRFKANPHDENHCDTISPSERSSDESSSKYSENRCRSSTFDLQNPQCPICQTSLNSQEMHTHIQQELDTIERTRQQQKYSLKRSSIHLNNGNTKILQENTINNIDQTFKTRYETFMRVRTSRQQRLNAKLQLHNRRINRHETRNCPICYQLIPLNTDEEYFFTHVQQCSRKREQLAANAALAALPNQHRLSSTPPPLPIPTVQDDPDINVVDMDDHVERDENHSNRQSTNETTNSTVDQSDDRCQESCNSEQRFSSSTQKSDMLYSSTNVAELDPPKCVVCM